MGASRHKRDNRVKEKDLGVGAYLIIDFVGGAEDGDALHDAVQLALHEAYGEVGAARYEVAVFDAKLTTNGLRAVLHVPHAVQRRSVWAALTLLSEFGDTTARFTVVKHANTKDELEAEGTETE